MQARIHFRRISRGWHQSEIPLLPNTLQILRPIQIWSFPTIPRIGVFEAPSTSRHTLPSKLRTFSYHVDFQEQVRMETQSDHSMRRSRQSTPQPFGAGHRVMLSPNGAPRTESTGSTFGTRPPTSSCGGLPQAGCAASPTVNTRGYRPFRILGYFREATNGIPISRSETQFQCSSRTESACSSRISRIPSAPVGRCLAAQQVRLSCRSDQLDLWPFRRALPRRSKEEPNRRRIPRFSLSCRDATTVQGKRHRRRKGVPVQVTAVEAWRG